MNHPVADPEGSGGSLESKFVSFLHTLKYKNVMSVCLSVRVDVRHVRTHTQTDWRTSGFYDKTIKMPRGFQYQTAKESN